MSAVLLSDEAMRMIEARAILPFGQTGLRMPDDSWKVEFAEETIERLETFACRERRTTRRCVGSW